MGQWYAIVWTYAAFGLLVLLGLVFWRPKKPASVVTAIAFTYIGALAFLPAASYDFVDEKDVMPIWYIGVLIPTPFLAINKAWIAALAALAVGLRFDWRRIAAFRPSFVDLPIALFCLLPFLQMMVVKETADPSTFKTFLLLTGCWGLPWLLGRVWLHDREGRTVLADALILITLLLLPIAVIEGLSPQRVHGLIYGPAPFAFDGLARAVGFRPLGFFEHGNQYGIWVCAAAFGGWWRARHLRREDHAALRWLAALVLLAMALAAQSAGGIVLLVLAIVWLEFAPLLDRFPWLWRVGFSAFVFAVITLGRQIYVSSKTGYEAPLLRQLTSVFTEARQNSLVWRMDRALDSMGRFTDHLALGQARWDWYRDGALRPWDLTLMLVGQFGLVGLGLIVLAVVCAVMMRRRDLAGGAGSARHVMLGIAAMSIADAFMNTYVFYPALVMLGSLATSPVRIPPRASDGRRFDEDRRASAPEPSWLDSAPAATRPGKKM
jgi:hypothetical protein